MWFIFAVLSAVFAALTSILAKVGIDRVNSNLAMAWGMVFLTGTQNEITEINRKSWLFLILSGLATGASWLCYYKALQIGEASKVVPVEKYCTRKKFQQLLTNECSNDIILNGNDSVQH